MSAQDELELAVQQLSSDVTLLCLTASVNGTEPRRVVPDLMAIRDRLNALIAEAYRKEAA